ncbi:MAG: mechanosensitive ion channel family protein [Erysipelotrichaceae bacterium]|nr:mechanosensitive ion channel family protein [Erysipelotrichaceae bacterium]
MSQIDWNEVLKELKINATSLVVGIIGILVVLLMAKIALALLTRFTTRLIKRGEAMEDKERGKELITSMTLVRSAGRYLIYFLATCIIINQLGYGSALSNVVTAASVGALVISLGAQSIIKDIIAGAFIIFERQYGVGDFVKINDFEGTVTSLAMRCTYLKTWKGEKIIIPNGQISTVVNYSGDFNMAIVEVPAPYEEDSDRIMNILKEIANSYYDSHQDICYEKPNVLGINSFDDSAVRYGIYQKAVKRNHYQIQRELKVLVKKRFDAEGISIPYSQVVVHQED